MEWSKHALVYLKQDGSIKSKKISKYTGLSRIVKICCALSGLGSHNRFESHRDKICLQSENSNPPALFQKRHLGYNKFR